MALEGIVNQKRLIEAVAQSVKNVLLAQQQSVNEGMLVLKADMTDRIFLNGVASDGSSIGSYSTTPMYASINQTSQVRASSLRPRGKNAQKGQRNQGTFKNGKPRKSMYLPGGYSEFRKVVGRQNAKVDLMLTGSLKADIRLGTTEGQSVLSFTTDKQKEIAAGNEKRFNKTIFSASQSELDTLVESWQDQVAEAFFSAFT